MNRPLGQAVQQLLPYNPGQAGHGKHNLFAGPDLHPLSETHQQGNTPAELYQGIKAHFKAMESQE